MNPDVNIRTGKQLHIATRSIPEDTFHAQQDGCHVYISRCGNKVNVEADGFGDTVTLKDLARAIKTLTKRNPGIVTANHAQTHGTRANP